MMRFLWLAGKRNVSNTVLVPYGTALKQHGNTFILAFVATVHIPVSEEVARGRRDFKCSHLKHTHSISVIDMHALPHSYKVGARLSPDLLSLANVGLGRVPSRNLFPEMFTAGPVLQRRENNSRTGLTTRKWAGSWLLIFLPAPTHHGGG